MKQVLLFVVGCMMCASVKAQHQQVLDEYLREAGDFSELFVGKLEVGYSPAVYLNFPYLPSDDFVKGDVMYNGLWYRNVSLRYDAFQEQLVVNTPESKLNVCVPMRAVGQFKLDGVDYERRDGEFVAILFRSPRVELIEQVSLSVREEFIGTLSFKYKFDLSVKYFVWSEGRRYEVSKLRSIQKLYPSIKKELKSFSKQNRLDFKKHCKSSLASLLKYADKLLTTPLK